MKLIWGVLWCHGTELQHWAGLQHCVVVPGAAALPPRRGPQAPGNVRMCAAVHPEAHSMASDAEHQAGEGQLVRSGQLVAAE